jgi:hypothetical protein
VSSIGDEGAPAKPRCSQTDSRQRKFAEMVRVLPARWAVREGGGAVLVRLAVEWTDPFGIVHDAGDVVDIDVITLAELEERGVVEPMSDSEEWTGQDEAQEETTTPEWSGPGEQEAEPEWSGPGETEDAEATEE